ncbi:MAG: ChbG/HpnK family deacetylase, partial [Burkholderiaceae bacterium]
MKSRLNGLPRLLAVCADDFGLSPGVSAGIAQLARSQRISAVSCLTNVPDWDQSAPALSDLPTSVAVGLHINLTEGQPLSPELAALWPTLPSLPRLMALAHLGLVPQAAVQREIVAQWGAFLSHAGQRPQFVDGHQHVHQFPGVRTAMLGALDQLQARPAVRSAAHLIGPGHGFKRWVIRQTGARCLLAKLRERHLRTN